MKLPDKVNPAHCVSKDGTRYALNFMQVKDGLGIATDGRMLIVAQVAVQEDDTITEGLVPPAAIKQSLKNKYLKGEFKFVADATDSEKIDVQVPINCEASTTYFGPSDVDYPTALKVIPTHAKPLSISFDAKRLAQLADSLGEKIVTLTVDVENPGACFIVTSVKQAHAFALLMPARDATVGVEWEPAKNHTLDLARQAHAAQSNTNPAEA